MKAAEYRQRVTEGEFQESVIALAKLSGWKVAHFRPALTEKGWRTPMQGDKGFPDLVLARRGVILFAELKVKGRRVTNEQAEWGAAIGDHWYVWRPSDMESIRKVLA